MKQSKNLILKALPFLILFTIASPYAEAQTVEPAYRSGPWVRTGGPMGGLGYDIRYNFADHSVWYVTDASAGFNISVDGGQTWKPSNTGIISSGAHEVVPVFSATVDPHNPSTIWIGTNGSGEIFKSTDGGQTWKLKRKGVDLNLRPMSFRGFTVDPRTSDIVYAMAEIASPGWTADPSQRKGLEMDLTQGIVYKTTDGGQNWKQIWRGDNLARYCWIHPQHPDTLYVSTGIFDREAANTDTSAGFAGGVGILKSTNGGVDWQVLNQANGLMDLYVCSLFMHPTNPDMLLAAANQNNWSNYRGKHTGGVYLTEDGGEHWDRVLEGQGTEQITTVEYSISDPDVAYAAGSDAVYRSEDGGHSWQRFTRADGTWGPDGIVAGTPIDLQCDPDNPLKVFVNNYLGGNFFSVDGGQSWTLDSDGYTGALPHHIGIAANNPNTLIVTTRSGVFRSNNGGAHWFGRIHPPQGMNAKFNEIAAFALNPNNPDHILVVPADFRTVLYSTTGGQDWKIGSLLGAAKSLAFAPSDPQTVYAITDEGLFVSHDSGVSFAPTGSKHFDGISMVVHPTDSKTVYIATANAELLKTTDGGQSTSTIGTGLPSSFTVRTLAIQPSHPQIMFAGIGVVDSFEGDGVYKSIDAGVTWAQSSAGMEANAQVRSIAIDPVDDQVIYASDYFSGVYVSTDGGAVWRTINDGLGPLSVNVLALSNDGAVLYAGIEGAGIYRLGDPGQPTSVATANALPDGFHLEQNYPNPFNPSTTIKYQLAHGSDVKLQILNIRGQVVRTLVATRQAAGPHTVSWDGRNGLGVSVSSGIYLYRIDVSGFQRSGKMLVIR